LITENYLVIYSGTYNKKPTGVQSPIGLPA